jgi:hypothetical protein
VSVRLKQLVSWWFILQILLPFTAPLQTLDVHDLLGTKGRHSTQKSPESTTTPTIAEASAAAAVVAVHAPTMLAAIGPAVACRLSTHAAPASTYTLSTSPQVQRSVLRL